jgi:glycosyltransferase involved in cell wall biosynthesis
MRKKVCYIISNVTHSHVFEATARFFDQSKYELSFILLNPSRPPLANALNEIGLRVEWVKFSSKRDLPGAVFQIRGLLKDIKPDIVHTHLIEASMAGLTAAWLCGVRNRIHTRHHSTESHVFHPHAVRYDRFVNRLSRQIIAVTGMVKNILVEKENVAPEKITVIHHGFDFSAFKTDEGVTNALREKYDLTGSDPVIGVISRFVEWKGVQYIIPAFAKLVKEFPRAKLVLANAVGNYQDEIERILHEHLLPSQYTLIPFESNVFDLYKTFDVFVHVPVNGEHEAFGQTYVEALFLEIPSVVTLSGVAHDFIRDGENAIVVPHRDSGSIYQGMLKLLKDRQLGANLTEKGKIAAEKNFNIQKFVDDLDIFYQGILR